MKADFQEKPSLEELINAAKKADAVAAESKNVAEEARSRANKDDAAATNAWNAVHKALLELNNTGSIGFSQSDLGRLLQGRQP